LPSPGKQSWTLGRKSGLEKRSTALHELPGPGKPKPDMQKDNCIAVFLVSASKTGYALEQMHFTLPVPANTSRTCKRTTSSHCCMVPARKTGTKRTAPLPGPGKKNRSFKRATVLQCSWSQQTKAVRKGIVALHAQVAR
jgi:hypothetical protein